MKLRWILALAIPAVIFASCSATTDSGKAVGSESDVTTYEALAQRVQSRVEDYRGSMMAPGMISVSECRSAEHRYESGVGPLLTQMQGMSAGMDEMMDSYGGAERADIACVAERMLEEFDRHAQLACGAADLNADRAEADQHASRMLGYASHSEDRCEELMHAGQQGDFSWGPMMSDCSGTGPGPGMMGDGGYGGYGPDMMGDGGYGPGMMGEGGYGPGMMGHGRHGMM